MNAGLTKIERLRAYREREREREARGTEAWAVCG